MVIKMGNEESHLFIKTNIQKLLVTVWDVREFTCIVHLQNVD